jgi:hypothetical protein
MKLTMRQNSLLNALHNAFKGQKYVERAELMRITKKMKHRESYGERELRRLANNGLIEKELEDNYIVGYYNLKIK